MEKITKKKEVSVYQGDFIQVLNRTFEVTKSDNQHQFTMELARRAPGVRLLILKNNSILLNREYRAELDCWDYRLPGGKVFDKLSEFVDYADNEEVILSSAMTAAQIEGREEAGIEVNSCELFHKSKAGSTIEWDLYYFLVTNFNELLHGNEVENDEIIHPEWIELETAATMCFDGRFKEDRSIGVLTKFLFEKGTLSLNDGND